MKQGKHLLPLFLYCAGKQNKKHLMFLHIIRQSNNRISNQQIWIKKKQEEHHE